MRINMLKNFISTNESKIYIEYNQLSIEFQEKMSQGILFMPPNPQWKGSENNIIMNKIFYDLDKKYCLMKCVFQDYKSEIYNGKGDFQNIQYVRDGSMVIDYFFNQFSCVKKFTVIGYSWGCSIVLNLLMRRPEITNFILISPTLTLKNCDWFNCLSTFRTTGMIIHGTKDNLTNMETVKKYVKFLETKKMNVQLHFIENADHYYHNYENELENVIESFLQNENNFKSNDENIK